jgi:uncharacterized protein (TIGR03000 family)
MNRTKATRLVGVVVLSAALLAVTAESSAGWGTGYGGYSFSAVPYSTWTVGYSSFAGYDYPVTSWGYGCYDSCWGVYRPGLLARMADCWRTRRAARWSGCWWPRYHVAWRGVACCDPCCVVCGCDPCGCDPCCGTTWQSEKVYDVVPGWEPPPAGPTPGEPETEMPSSEMPLDDSDLPSVLPEQQTGHRLGNAILTVQVPQGTQIFVNGVRTTSQGTVRRYVSRDLTPGYQYTYEVRAESHQAGRPTTQTKTVHLRAGQSAELVFDATDRSAIETALTVNVPSDARVFLAGNKAPGTGLQRTYRTTRLTAGDAWKDYLVRVEVDRDGKTMSQEKNITLQAGDRQDLTFHFELDRLAIAH